MRPFLAPPASAALEPGPAPTFSVLITCYQAADTVGDAVQSALAQSRAPHEVIVVDDGSTDGTREALAPFLDRIDYVRQANRGHSAALNAGVQRASGDFVVLLDADDAYEPERIEALTELAVARPDLDVLMTDAHLEVNGRVVSRFTERTPFAVEDQRLAIFERCFIAWPAVRRRLLLDAGGFDESLRRGKDWEAWIRLLHAGASAGLVDEPLHRYRIKGEGSLTDDRVAALRARVVVLERAARLDLSPPERAQLEHFLGRRRRRALLAEAEQALRAGSPDARRLAVRVASMPGMPAGTRAKALAAIVAPRAAGRRLDRREAELGGSRIRRGLPGETPDKG
jgi:Glycosyl transferase family 2